MSDRKATLTYRKQANDSQGCFSDYESDSGVKLAMVSLFRWDLGDHLCTWRWSNDHGIWLYGLPVAGHKDIELHLGNVAGDVAQGYQTDSEGCGLPGMSVVTFPAGTVLTPKHKPMVKAQLGVSGSRTALARLQQDMLEGGKQVPFILSVKEA